MENTFQSLKFLDKKKNRNQQHESKHKKIIFLRIINIKLVLKETYTIKNKNLLLKNQYIA